MSLLQIDDFRLHHYKAFRNGTHHVPLAPLTLVIGYNNAGKSALVRAPALFADGLRPRSGRTGLFDYQARGFAYGQRYADLVYDGRVSEPMRFSIGFHLHGEPMRWEVEVQGTQERGGPITPRLIRWALTSQQSGRAVEVRWQHGDVYHLDGEPIPIAGLGPSLEALLERGDGLGLDLARIGASRSLGDAIHHLAPVRRAPEATFPLVDEPTLGPDGSGAAQILAADERGSGSLHEGVARWFRDHLGYEVLPQVFARGDAEHGELRVRSSGSGGANIRFSGAGVAQILPLVVRRHQLGDPSWAHQVPALQVLEQPELHLHPAAHAPVAELLMDMARSGSCKLLVETHSENLLLRIRRRIAEGRFAATDVAVLLVESADGGGAQVRQLPIRDDGWIEGWPAKMFHEDAVEARALARAMREREAAAAREGEDTG